MTEEDYKVIIEYFESQSTSKPINDSSTCDTQSQVSDS